MTSLHVLVVDDETATRQILAETVSNGGFSVDSAADVAQATAKLARGEVDVVLCDIQLPDGSGIDLLRRSREAGLNASFVMVTAFGSVETAVEALRAGAFDYIIKPARHEEILHRLHQIANLRNLREENRSLRDRVRQFETENILRAIADAGGDRKLAAQKLGISLSSLYAKLSSVEKK